MGLTASAVFLKERFTALGAGFGKGLIPSHKGALRVIFTAEIGFAALGLLFQNNTAAKRALRGSFKPYGLGILTFGEPRAG